MKIVNLIEDTKGAEGLLYEHGLSFYVETEKHKLLVDTGATDAFIANAGNLVVDLRAVDTVIVSHGHYDHAGGVLAFAEINPHAVIYINKNAVGEFYNCREATPKYIGMHKDIAKLSQVVFLDGNAVLDDEISVFTGVFGEKLQPRGNSVLRKKQGADFVQDGFEHEQYVLIAQGDTKVLISGCAHKGIVNILDTYTALYGGAPTHVVSGFHTVKKEYDAKDDRIIEETAKCLSALDVKFYSGHCTGDYPMEIMKSIMGDKLTVIHSGDTVIQI